MSKVKFNKIPLVYPLPCVLIGAVVDDKANFTTIGNLGIINVNPSVIYISMAKAHCTTKGIKENQVFSINIPSADLAAKADYCGLVSGNHIDKSQIFKCTYKSSDKIPLIDECPVSMECKVVKSFDVYDMKVFISEVIETYVDDDLLTDGFPDTKKLNPLIYCMDNKYWSLGDYVGDAFKIGKDLTKNNKSIKNLNF